ncbi:MAG: phosphoadenylyl-sulfate reductase [Bacteroidota bacterium]
MDAKTLCATYAPYDHRKRLEMIFRDFDRVLVTSSFGTTSAILLHFLQQVRPNHPVYFIDTKYHFEETHHYKQTLEQRWKLNVQDLQPGFNAHAYTRMDFTWTHDPDVCCFVNKVEPLEKLKARHDIWISGMLGSGNTNRANLDLFRRDGDLFRFYPLSDISPEEVEIMKVIYELPSHPLERQGYESVGCMHCTIQGNGRAGRWAGSSKSECGLHLLS